MDTTKSKNISRYTTTKASGKEQVDSHWAQKKRAVKAHIHHQYIHNHKRKSEKWSNYNCFHIMNFSSINSKYQFISLLTTQYTPLCHHLKNPHQTFCCDEDGISALSLTFACLFLAFSSPGTLVQNAGVLGLPCQPESHLYHIMIDNYHYQSFSLLHVRQGWCKRRDISFEISFNLPWCLASHGGHIKIYQMNHDNMVIKCGVRKTLKKIFFLLWDFRSVVCINLVCKNNWCKSISCYSFNESHNQWCFLHYSTYTM